VRRAASHTASLYPDEWELIESMGFKSLTQFVRAGLDIVGRERPEYLERLAKEKDTKITNLTTGHGKHVQALTAEATAYRHAAEAIRAVEVEKAAAGALAIHTGWTPAMEEVTQLVLQCLTYREAITERNPPGVHPPMRVVGHRKTYTPDTVLEILRREVWGERIERAGWGNPENALQMALEAIEKRGDEKVEAADLVEWVAAAPEMVRR